LAFRWLWLKNIFLSQYLFIAISFYRNIVRENVSCELGLNVGEVD